MVAGICKKHNLLVLSDEVYEWMTYEGREHVRIAAVEGMWERTVSVLSAGKMFSVTGWKVGWAIGPAHLASRLEGVLQATSYSGCTPLQLAVAEGVQREVGFLGTPNGYLCELSGIWRRRGTPYSLF